MVPKTGPTSRVADQLDLGGLQFSFDINDSRLFATSIIPIVIAINNIKTIFNDFSKLCNNNKSTLRIAIDRLNRCLRGRSLEDKAIDLGVATEIMLLHDLGTGERGEIRYRSAVRGARLLGIGAETRNKIFSLLRKAYDLRSKAVHSGSLDPSDGGINTESVIADASKACALIARAVIQRGGFPKNWETEFVLADKAQVS